MLRHASAQPVCLCNVVFLHRLGNLRLGYCTERPVRHLNHCGNIHGYCEDTGGHQPHLRSDKKGVQHRHQVAGQRRRHHEERVPEEILTELFRHKFQIRFEGDFFKGKQVKKVAEHRHSINKAEGDDKAVQIKHMEGIKQIAGERHHTHPDLTHELWDGDAHQHVGVNLENRLIKHEQRNGQHHIKVMHKQL